MEDVRVKLCFLVKVLKVRGWSVGGGRIIGRIVVLVGVGGWKGCKGWVGVVKVGEEDGIGFFVVVIFF